MERWQKISRKLGFAGFGVLGCAFALTVFALLNGIHCPDCDQPPHYDAWKTCFAVKDAVYFASLPMLLLAIPLGAPKRHLFILGVAASVFAIALTPM